MQFYGVKESIFKVGNGRILQYKSRQISFLGSLKTINCVTPRTSSRINALENEEF